MLRLMRNIHLGLGLMFALVAMVFAASSLVIIYRPWLGTAVKPTEVRIPLSAAAAAGPRAAARELMTAHGFRGELRQIQQRGGTFSFVIVRPGESNAVTYAPSSGAATIATTRQGTLETLVQLHTTSGFWHDYLPSNLWAALALLGSAGLILLGVTGIYLWFLRYRSWVGGVLLGFGVILACITLVLTRLQQ